MTLRTRYDGDGGKGAVSRETRPPQQSQCAQRSGQQLRPRTARTSSAEASRGACDSASQTALSRAMLRLADRRASLEST